ncbi:integral membrane protein [Rhodotorula toruloides]|uniref:Integral membrane protein n=1 Tax=Rhodotorula toruloides TaxID=5286 RepID=A0A511KHH3_RHOTO|nr:integral membrane protein [Rhodotorula toruloides]
MRAAVLVLLAATATLALPSVSPSPPRDLARRRSADAQYLEVLVPRHGDDDDDDLGAMEHAKAMTSGQSAHDDTAAPASSVEAQAHSRGDEHARGHSHAKPLLELNETQILLTHSPDPPAYWDFDHSDEGKPAVLYVHIALMTLAYFVLLPLALFLKAGRSALSIIPQTGFLVTSVLGLFFGQVYNGLTPEMYKGSSHTTWGWITMVLAVALNILDVGRFLLRFTRWGNKLDAKLAGLSMSEQYEKDERSVFRLGADEDEGDEAERLVSSPVAMHLPAPSPSRGNSLSFSDEDTAVHSDEADWREPTRPKSTRQKLHRYLGLAADFAERMLVLLAYVEVCTGVAVWTGRCRENYLNGCLAHIIKGSIFVWYGLLTFARYCGAFSSLGWAWNRHPARNNSIWTAEFVESLVIFIYGSTNTWMERMGKTGAYSVKDIQHISIAVMFWGAGALGMVLESRTIRSWLATPAAQASGRTLDTIPPPPSAAASFNPFPAIAIGITGWAMSAHHQTYQFQVEVHALWGLLLGCFSLFRFLTYFFTYLRPPASILPSRPPTEALASLCLTAGGVVFILSTEQVTFAAMRHNADDVMAFLNLTIAAVCVWFFWIAALFAVKGWALGRSTPQSSASIRAKAVVSP